MQVQPCSTHVIPCPYMLVGALGNARSRPATSMSCAEASCASSALEPPFCEVGTPKKGVKRDGRQLKVFIWMAFGHGASTMSSKMEWLYIYQDFNCLFQQCQQWPSSLPAWHWSVRPGRRFLAVVVAECHSSLPGLVCACLRVWNSGGHLLHLTTAKHTNQLIKSKDLASSEAKKQQNDKQYIKL